MIEVVYRKSTWRRFRRLLIDNKWMMFLAEINLLYNIVRKLTILKARHRGITTFKVKSSLLQAHTFMKRRSSEVRR